MYCTEGWSIERRQVNLKPKSKCCAIFSIPNCTLKLVLKKLIEMCANFKELYNAA